MFGYILAILIALVFIGVVVGQLSSSRPPRRPGTPVGPDKPSADEPTPARSATASEATKQTAAKHTPPA
ncbi:MAG TPA: hypothetical protein VFJ90_11770 [Candidatus Didemnitutus sp.]|nr:hypothetical protein [Candidatus Didemnitutus sp.]